MAGEPAQTWEAFGRVVGFGTASLSLDRVAMNRDGRPRLVSEATRTSVLQALGSSWAEQLTVTPHDVVGDPAALKPAAVDTRTAQTEDVANEAERALVLALAEVERLARRNESLELRLDELAKKQRRLKRRLSAVA